MKQYDVKDVAIYLRKSRGEEEDLIKHKTTLVELCVNNSWRYVIYAEIGTSDSITLRPEMTRLLGDVQEELFDAVVVMDFDRLSRGDSEDQGKIKNILRKAETLIITPQRIYDLSDDGDDMMSDFEGLMARYEYKQIKKRFKRGKRMGTKLGRWTTGFPPFPYINSPDKSGLIINPDEYPLYRRMVDMVLKEGMRPVNVAVQFNKEGIKSRKGTQWLPSSVYRTLRNEVALGKVIGNKYREDPDGKKRLNPESKWVVVDNCHEPVLTQDEFDRVSEFITRKYLQKPKQMIFRTSGLIFCADCGAVMTIVEYKSGESIKACNRCDPYGNRCKNGGGNTAQLESILLQEIKKYSDNLRQAKGEEYVVDNYDKIIDTYEKELKTLEKQLTKIDSLVEADYYSIDEAKKRKSSVLSKVEIIQKNIDEINHKIKMTKANDISGKIDKVDAFLGKLEAGELSKEDTNRFYRALISKVIWRKSERHGEPEISIVYN